MLFFAYRENRRKRHREILRKRVYSIKLNSFVLVSCLMMTAGSTPAQVYVRESRKVDKYSALNAVIDLLQKNHTREMNRAEIIAAMLRAIKIRFDIPVSHTLTGNKLYVTYKGTGYVIGKAYRVRLAELNDHLREDIRKMMNRYEINRQYQYLLIDLMLSELGGDLYPLEFAKHYTGNYQNNLRLKTAANRTRILSRSVSGHNGALSAGSELLAVDSIPMRVLTTSLFDDYIFYRRDSLVWLSVVAGADTLRVRYRNSDNKNQDRITSSIERDSILYIRLKSFGEKTADSVASRYQRDSVRIKHVVFDVRGCPDGLFSETYKTIGLFLKDTITVAELKWRNKKPEQKKSPGTGKIAGLPLTILIDPYTSFHAELFTQALVAHAAATTIGQPTAGNCFIRSSFYLSRRKYQLFFPGAEMTVTGGFVLGRDRVQPRVAVAHEVTHDELIDRAISFRR